MNLELATRYDPAESEPAIGEKWLRNKAAATSPDERAERYVIMMPLPNVTGALHMGHAMDNVMQDLLIRWHRMMGENTLWMAGTDHAGIATQAVVEKRLKELEGKTRRDVGREELVLMMLAEPFEPPTEGFSDSAAHSTVDLIENQRSRRRILCLGPRGRRQAGF